MTNRITAFICSFLFLLLFTAYVWSSDSPTYVGKVIKVIDGDSINILVNREQIKIRLAEIDTPERGQPYWRVSTDALAKLVAGKVVTVKQVDIDRYGRVVGQVYVDDNWVNLEMVRLGEAWVYPKYAKSQELNEAEKKAKVESVGLWRLPERERVPPWEWRKSR